MVLPPVAPGIAVMPEVTAAEAVRSMVILIQGSRTGATSPAPCSVRKAGFPARHNRETCIAGRLGYLNRRDCMARRRLTDNSLPAGGSPRPIASIWMRARLSGSASDLFTVFGIPQRCNRDRWTIGTCEAIASIRRALAPLACQQSATLTRPTKRRRGL